MSLATYHIFVSARFCNASWNDPNGLQIQNSEALQAGLVSRLVDDSKVMEETMKVAQKIASMSRSVIALGKRIFYVQSQLPLTDAYRLVKYIYEVIFCCSIDQFDEGRDKSDFTGALYSV